MMARIEIQTANFPWGYFSLDFSLHFANEQKKIDKKMEVNCKKAGEKFQ